MTANHARHGRLAAAAAVAIAMLLSGAALAEDWSTYRHDNRRSAVTGEKLPLPLKEIWRHGSPAPPQPAWTGPAKWDAYRSMKGLPTMRDFDPAFFVTVSGSKVTFGSSADDSVHCIDAETGKQLWTFTTEGPVRLPPAWDGGKVYFGSDDGFAYCLDGASGKLVWKYRPAESDAKVSCNGKMISLWPIRTGVLVADGKAYFAASLVPWEASYVCAVDAATGSDKGQGCFKVQAGYATFQGAMLATKERLIIMQGRLGSVAFSRADGANLGGAGAGGVHGVISEENTLASGPPSRGQTLLLNDANSGGKGRQLGGVKLVLFWRGAMFMYKPGALIAQNVPADAADNAADTVAKKPDEAGKAQAAAGSWQVNLPAVYSLAIAGETLFVGGEGSVTAYEAKTGKEVWKAEVSGKAHGLAVAGGKLLVSTNDGTIHCFGPAR
ncbi:MAG TPA: PQQ-binding-like beta-propeller repeat protein [Phycisphaerae bacterium]|nr:PQQ-binding-like beta-propeller repeat protein [Phycisphaerae bacterium]